MHQVTEWIIGQLGNMDFRKRDCSWCSVWLQDKCLSELKVQLDTSLKHVQLDFYREGLKLLVGVWMNHLYIQHIKSKQEKKKAKEVHDHQCFY